MKHSVSKSILLAGLLSLPAFAQGSTVVQADRLIIAPGTSLEGSAALLAYRDGKVTGVGTEIPAATLESATRIKYAGTLVPGFVNPHNYLDLGGDLAETIDAFTPALRAADAFDPFGEELVRQARSGVVGVGLAPLSSNTFGGLAAVVSWDGEMGQVLRPASYLKLSLVTESLTQAGSAIANPRAGGGRGGRGMTQSFGPPQNRYPTSRMGATDLIRSSLEDANHPLAGANPDHRVLKDVLDGGQRIAIHVRSHAEINIALDLCAEFSLQPILIGGDELAESISRLRGTEISVILSPLSLDSSREHLQLPGKLAAAGIPFSFMAGDGDALRLSAALALRAGLGREAAMAALTSTAAEQCGVDDDLGSLRIGHAASFAVFSGDPLDLSSQLIAVHINGNPIALEKGKDEAR